MSDTLDNATEATNVELPAGIGQVVLVLQGGGALGAYQVGVYQALHEAGIEPDWVIGTSIGAINASIIAGNEPADRMSRLKAFWRSVEHGPFQQALWISAVVGSDGSEVAHHGERDRDLLQAQSAGVRRGHMCRSVPMAAGYYSTAPLQATLNELVDFDLDQPGHDASDGRRRQCAHERDALLRQPRDAARCAPCHGVGRIAAGVSRRSASTASSTGMAASCRTRRSRRCSTTIHGAIRWCLPCISGTRTAPSRRRSGRS